MKSVLEIQHGGSHYKSLKIQPVEIALANDLGICEFSALKYIMRHDNAGGEGSSDIRKAIHYLQILLEVTYDNRSKIEYDGMANDDNDDWSEEEVGEDAE